MIVNSKEENLAQGSKIIILSNQGLDSDLEKAKSLKVDGYIVKASAIPSEVLAEATRIIEGGAPQPGAGAPQTTPDNQPSA